MKFLELMALSKKYHTEYSEISRTKKVMQPIYLQ